MTTSLRNGACLSASLIALVVAGTARADTAAASTDATMTPKDTAEIIVTAQKRPERLQDIPVAAAVLSADTVAQQHVTDLSDINRVVPSVEIKGTFNGRVPYGMRGISTNANEGTIGLTSGVNIQIDGVPVPADSFAANNIADVSQLEVLKGPQATLGGRTASAGEINFVTFGPTRNPVFGLDSVFTNDNERRVSVHASGPLTDNLMYSFAGTYADTPYPVRNTQLGVKSHAENYAVRGKLKYQSGDFDATLMAHYALSPSRGENFTFQYLTPTAELLGAPPLTKTVLYGNNPLAYGNTTYSSPVDMTSRYEDKDAALVLNYRLGTTTLTSTTSFFRENQFQSQDLFETQIYFFNYLTGGAAPPFNDMQTSTGYVKQTTQEFKIATDAARPLSALVGAFYSDSTTNAYSLRSFVGAPVSAINISTTKSYAVYGRATGKLSDQFSVIGGLRWNHDEIEWDKSQLFDPAANQFQGCASGSVGSFPCEWNLSSHSSTLVGDFSAQYHPSRTTMVYGSYTRGYKPAAYNTNWSFSSLQSAPSAADASLETPTKGETIDSFEVGLKAQALNHHLVLDLAAFHTNYKNYQVQIFNNNVPGNLGGQLFLDNAGARTQGIEADLNYVRHDTRVSLSGAWIDAIFKDFTGAPCYPLQTSAAGCTNSTQNLSGVSMPDSPKFKVNGSVTQTVPFDHFNLVLGGNVSYRSGANFQPDQNPYTYQGAFALVDLNLGFQTKEENMSLTAFVNNLTNHFYNSNMEDFFSAPFSGTGNAVIGQPARDSHRYYGVRFSVKI
jgi:iron complex outermembrane recepter protein